MTQISKSASDGFESLRPTAYASRIQRWYLPILLVLTQAGGKATTKFIYLALERRFGDFIPIDGYEKLKGGQLRWKNEVSLAGADLAGRIYDPDLISRNGGIWELTIFGDSFVGYTVS